MEIITVWSTVDKDGNIKHNHIEDGWKYEDFPKPIKEDFSNQRAWKKLSWTYQHGYLMDDNKIVIV